MTLTSRILRREPDLALTLREGGSGAPLLVLHGGAGPDSVTPIAEHYLDSHHVIVPTHPGWSNTVRPEWLTSVNSLACIYLDLLASYVGLADQAGQGEVTVIGNSFGGWVASEMAALRPTGLFSRLVLIDAIGPAIPGHAVAVPTPRSASAIDSPELTRGPSRSALTALHAYSRLDLQDPQLLPRLASVQIPTLVVWGEHDPVVSPAFGRAYAEAFLNNRFEVIRGGGHIPTVEAPKATFAVIDEFLAEHDRPG